MPSTHGTWQYATTCTAQTQDPALGPGIHNTGIRPYIYCALNTGEEEAQLYEDSGPSATCPLPCTASPEADLPLHAPCLAPHPRKRGRQAKEFWVTGCITALSEGCVDRGCDSGPHITHPALPLAQPHVPCTGTGGRGWPERQHKLLVGSDWTQNKEEGVSPLAMDRYGLR